MNDIELISSGEGQEAVLLRQQDVLAKFGELALQSEDMDGILTEACRLVGEGLGTDLAKVMELQDDGRTLLVRAGVGWTPGIVGHVRLDAVGHTSESYALETREPMISPDIETETRFSYPAFLIDHGVRAVANVVILGGHGKPPFGILQVDSRTPRQFTERETGFLRSYANLLAAAVDRIRATAAMRDERERLRLALDAGELGSFELDLATGITACTPRVLQIFGYADPAMRWTYEIFLGHVLPQDRDRVAATLRAAVEGATEWQFECRIHRVSDDAVRWIEAKGGAAGGHGNTPPTYLLGILADVTARRLSEDVLLQTNEALEAQVAERTGELAEAGAKLQVAAEEREQVEEALRQSQKMEAIGQLTGGLAHDFNNLLGAISGSLEMIGTRVSQGRIADLGRYLDAAMASTDRAATLTQRLLAFARRQTLDPKATRVDDLIESLADLFRRTLGPAIQLETKLTPTLWLPLCDPNQLESALLNIVINARDAMPDGGRLTIEAVNATLPDPDGMLQDAPFMSLPPGDYVALFVTDTGCGMTPEVAGRAFDPFFTTKPMGQGTGLGLSMIHGFVHQSGGQVRLRSKVGRGTTVALFLPRYLGLVEIGAGLPTMPEAAQVAAGPSVLVVEDETYMRLVIVDALSDLGYAVLEAADGPAGLQITQSEARIDLLVTDVGLPGGLNGRQLADAARTLRPDLKVLFITGFANGVFAGGNLEGPGIQLLTKPFRLRALLERVQDMIAA